MQNQLRNFKMLHGGNMRNQLRKYTLPFKMLTYGLIRNINTSRVMCSGHKPRNIRL